MIKSLLNIFGVNIKKNKQQIYTFDSQKGNIKMTNIKKIAIWEDLGMNRPTNISGVDRVLVLMEKKINEIVDEVNSR